MKLAGLIVVLLAQPAFAQTGEAPKSWSQRVREGRDLHATLRTSGGDIVVRLFTTEAPKTVENFVALATGEKKWADAITKKVQTRPLYDGVIFHRVIPGHIIEAGDPTGHGFFGPGYTLENEHQSGRQFNKAGLVAMSNATGNANASQFFITLAPVMQLTGSFTIFGEVISGMDVVTKIANAPREPKTNRPEKPVTIKTIAISEPASVAGTRDQKQGD